MIVTELAFASTAMATDFAWPLGCCPAAPPPRGSHRRRADRTAAAEAADRSWPPKRGSNCIARLAAAQHLGGLVGQERLEVVGDFLGLLVLADVGEDLAPLDVRLDLRGSSRRLRLMFPAVSRMTSVLRLDEHRHRAERRQ